MSAFKVRFFDWYYRARTEARDAILKLYLVSNGENVANGDNMLIVLGRSRLKSHGNAWYIGVGYQPHLGRFLGGIYDLRDEAEAEAVLRTVVMRDYDNPDAHLHLLFNTVPLQDDYNILERFSLIGYAGWREKSNLSYATFSRDPQWSSFRECQGTLTKYLDNLAEIDRRNGIRNE